MSICVTNTGMALGIDESAIAIARFGWVQKTVTFSTKVGNKDWQPATLSDGSVVSSPVWSRNRTLHGSKADA